MQYFRQYNPNDAVPCIDIPGRTFPVQSFYLEDVIEQTRYSPSKHDVFGDKQPAVQKQKQQWVDAQLRQLKAAGAKQEGQATPQSFRAVQRMDESRCVDCGVTRDAYCFAT